MRIGRPDRIRRDSEQSILPLINIVFLLLIFFMVAGKLSQSDLVRVDPPVSASEADADLHPGRFLIDRDGRLFHGGKEIARTEIDAIVAGLGESRDGILIKADSYAPTGEVLAIIASIRSAGAGEVRLLTQASTQ